MKKQKRIAKNGLTVDDGFFTVRMLDAIHAITRNIKGANPNNPNSEKQWLIERTEKSSKPSKKRGDSRYKHLKN